MSPRERTRFGAKLRVGHLAGHCGWGQPPVGSGRQGTTHCRPPKRLTTLRKHHWRASRVSKLSRVTSAVPLHLWQRQLNVKHSWPRVPPSSGAGPPGAVRVGWRMCKKVLPHPSNPRFQQANQYHPSNMAPHLVPYSPLWFAVGAAVVPNRPIRSIIVLICIGCGGIVLVWRL